MKHDMNGETVSFFIFLPLILALVSIVLYFIFPNLILIPVCLGFAAIIAASIIYMRIRASSKGRYKAITLLGMAISMIAVCYGCIAYIHTVSLYEEGIAYMQKENYFCAYISFSETNSYKDSEVKQAECQNHLSYHLAKYHAQREDYKAAADLFLLNLGDFADSAQLYTECEEKMK